LTWSVHEVSHFGLFREIGDFPNISQIMKKPIPYINSMFSNFTVIACTLLQFINFSGFYTLIDCKT
jgi:hypothetical protein